MILFDKTIYEDIVYYVDIIDRKNKTELKSTMTGEYSKLQPENFSKPKQGFWDS